MCTMLIVRTVRAYLALKTQTFSIKEYSSCAQIAGVTEDAKDNSQHESVVHSATDMGSAFDGIEDKVVDGNKNDAKNAITGVRHSIVGAFNNSHKHFAARDWQGTNQVRQF